MSYCVIFGAGGAVKFHDLPEAGRDAVVARAVRLAEAPWDGAWVTVGADPAFRETTFDDGRGLLWFYVDERAEVIRLYDIEWLG